MKKHQVVALLSFIIAIFQAYLISKSGDVKLPMQFDANGNPTWYLGPKMYFIWNFGFLFVVNLILFGSSYAIKRFSMRWVNIPWKEYWLSNEKLKNLSVQKLSFCLSIAALIVNLTSLLSQNMIAQKNKSAAALLPFNVKIWMVMTFSIGTSVAMIIFVFVYFKPFYKNESK